MKLEDQVTNLELSKKLKELGVKQESLWYWFNRGGEYVLLYDSNVAKLDQLPIMCISAFTVAELGEMLPCEYCSTRNQLGDWTCLHLNPDQNTDIFTKSEADARAKMLIYLLENNLVPHPKKEEVGEECYCDLGSPNKEVCPIHSKDQEEDIGIGPNSVGEYLVGPDKLDKGGEE